MSTQNDTIQHTFAFEAHLSYCNSSTVDHIASKFNSLTIFSSKKGRIESSLGCHICHFKFRFSLQHVQIMRARTNGSVAYET